MLKALCVAWTLWVGFISVAVILVASGLALVSFYTVQLPNSATFDIPERPPNVRFLASDGTTIANVGQYGGEAVSLEQLPSYVPMAFIAIEDRRFYQHFGIDLQGTIRALAVNVGGRGRLHGGSTITQQLAKNLFLSSDQSVGRKIQEALLALWLEQNFSKATILELYLNRIFFGTGATGIEAAAQTYFGRPASLLTLRQAALLAASVKAPSELNIRANPAAAQLRAGLVLDAMVEQGHLAADDRGFANTDASTAFMRERMARTHLTDWLINQFEQQFPNNSIDLVVETTIDSALQRMAQSLLIAELPVQSEKNPLEGALVSVDGGGAIKALVGGVDYHRSQFNRATDALRQPGSTFKPFVYAAALEAGYKPLSLVDDSPIGGKKWSPQNADGRFLGPITLKQALALSRNTVAAKLIYEMTPDVVAKMAQRMGIDSPLQLTPALALGTSEISLLDLTAAYAALSKGGDVVQPFAIEKVSAASGKVIFAHDGSINRVALSATIVSDMNEMLRSVVEEGTGRNAQLSGWDVAGKTGTTQRGADALFVGYSSHLVTGIWVGKDNNAATGTTGGGLPAKIWSKFMTAAHKGLSPTPLP